MKQLYILTDEDSQFLISKTDLRNFTTMNVLKIKEWFAGCGYSVKICKFSELNVKADYNNAFILYQTSESPGGFYKRYIEDLIYMLEERGAIVLPSYKYLKAHHDKVFMEFLRQGFNDETLKTIYSSCYGSWVDALNYDGPFPVVIKQASGSAGEKVFLANNRNQYKTLVRKAGKIKVAEGHVDMLSNDLKTTVKRIIKRLDPTKKDYVKYYSSPESSPVVVQNFVPGLDGDFRVVIFGGKYYSMHRQNRKNDFRASGSGQFSDVREEFIDGLYDFARKLTKEIDFPIIGMDIGFDGSKYHLIEYQMLNFGTSALQRSAGWHEYHNGKWIRYTSHSILENEFARSIDEYIKSLD